MTINKPNRLEWHDTQEAKIRYRKRAQEEQEAKRSLQDFLKHSKQEDEDDGYPTYPLQD